MSTSKKYGNWALIAVAMLLFGTAIATIQFKVPVVMGDIMANMDMDASSASWLMSIFTFVGIVLALPTGALAKKFGPKTMLLAAAAIIAAGSVSYTHLNLAPGTDLGTTPKGNSTWG